MEYFKLNQIVIHYVVIIAVFSLPTVLIASTERIICSTFDGWDLDFKYDGSASFSYGALPIDQALVAVGTFDIQLIEKEIRALNLDSNKNGKKLAVHFFKSGQISSIALYADDLVPCQNLIREVLLKSSFWDIKRFRETVAKYPPFEMQDIVITEEYVRNSQPVKISEEKVEGSLRNGESNLTKSDFPMASSTDLSAAKSSPLSASSRSKNDNSILSLKPYGIIILFFIIILCVLYVTLKKRK